MAKMDKAASSAVIVFVTNLHFSKPVHNGDIVIIYSETVKIGNSSIDINVIVRCKQSYEEHTVTSVLFTFATIDENGNPMKVRDVLRKNIGDDIYKLL